MSDKDTTNPQYLGVHDRPEMGCKPLKKVIEETGRAKAREENPHPLDYVPPATDKIAKMFMNGLPNSGKYEPWMPAKIVELMARGMSLTAVAPELGIAPTTLMNWATRGGQRSREPIVDAVEMGRALGLAWWEEQGRQGMWDARRFSAGTYATIMKNRFHEYGKAGEQNTALKIEDSPLVKALRSASKTIWDEEDETTRANVIGEE